MGDVGAIADLVNTLAKWLLDANGYATWSRERKLKELHDAVGLALVGNQWAALDLLLAEYKKLQAEA